MSDYLYNCLALREENSRTNFQSKAADLIANFKNRGDGVVKTPAVLYRGVRLYRDGEPNKDVAFFCADIAEAEKYAKLPPHLIYIFKPVDTILVLDMTNKYIVEGLQECAKECGLPVGIVTFFAAVDIAANKGYEYDMFHLLKEAFDTLGVGGFYRRTFSSTLQKCAVEFDIYRRLLPAHIQ